MLCTLDSDNREGDQWYDITMQGEVAVTSGAVL